MEPDGTRPPLTAGELSDHIQNAFVVPRPSTLDLLDAAMRGHARPAVLAALNRLPPRRFDTLDDVLSALPSGLVAEGERDDDWVEAE